MNKILFGVSLMAGGARRKGLGGKGRQRKDAVAKRI